MNSSGNTDTTANTHAITSLAGRRRLMPNSPGGADGADGRGRLAVRSAMVMLSCLTVLAPAQHPHLGDAEPEHDDSDQRRERGGVAELEVREGLLIGPGEQHLGRVIRAAPG